VFGTTSSFPTTLSAMPTETLLSAYASAPERVRAALQGLTDRQLRTPVIPGKWSILEIALHLTDSELMGGGRLRLAVAEPGAPFPGYDQDRWVAEWRHRQATAMDLEASLTLFAALRGVFSRAMQQLPEPEWQRAWGIHPEHGTLTLRNLLELYADHAERHLVQIRERRGLLGVNTNAVRIAFDNRLY
jgi:uncharacterized damage-inducible protein DinB